MLADKAVKTAFGLWKDNKTKLTFGELNLCDSFGKAIPLSVFSRLRR